MILKNFLNEFNEIFTFFIVFPFMAILGSYLTFKLKFIQISKLKLSFSYLLRSEKKEQGTISHYQAVSAVLAGNLGTGNISGVAVALATGGPGALVWMWVMAFLGAVIQYTSCLLGVKYREKNEYGEYVGGPMYYLNKGLGCKKLSIFFSFFVICGALTVGNFAQINSITLPLQNFSLDPFLISIVIAGVVGIVIVGGMQRFARLASSIVPLMALIYLAAASYIILINSDKIFPALQIMFSAAFNGGSIVGGILGYGIVKTMTTGFARGIFATDAGTGIAPIIQSSAHTDNPVIDGVIALIAPFIVMIICTITGIVLLVTDAWLIPELRSTNMCIYAFEKGLGHSLGGHIVLFSLLLFAFTTILAWSFCAERAVEYLWGRRYIRFFQILFILIIPAGAIAHVDLVWLFADIAISLMMLVNLIGIAGLSSEAIIESNTYFNKKDPVLLEAS
jgi:alanine or glycine:cation symporter, AGCS family